MRGILVIITVLLLLSGCTDRYSDRLLDVESVMQTDIEAAYCMLDSMDSNDFKTEADKALYGLLYTELHIKNRLPISVDSMINSSIRFFMDKSDKQHLAEAYIYKSHLHYTNGDYKEAMMAALAARDKATELADTFRLAKSHELMADIYNETYNVNAAVEQRRKATIYYKVAKKNLNYYYALVELAMSLSDAECYEESLRLLDSISFVTSVPEANVYLTRYYKEAYTYPLYYTGSFDEAKEIVLDLKTEEVSLTSSNCHKLGMIYLKEHKPDSTRYYSNICEKRRRSLSDSVLSVSLWLELARYNGDINGVIELSREHMWLQTKSIWDAFKSGVENASEEYFVAQNEKERLKLQKLRYRAVAVGLIVIILSVISYLWHRNKLYRRDLEISNKFAEIYNLKSRLQDSENEKDKLSTMVRDSKNQIGQMSLLINGLYKKHISVMDKLCDEYFEKQGSEKMRLLLYSEVEKLILDMKSPESIKALTEIVNQYKDGIIFKLRDEFPKFSENDIVFMTLVSAELSPRTICLLMGYKQSNFYAKRSRLRARIEVSDVPSKDQFLEIFKNQHKK